MFDAAIEAVLRRDRVIVAAAVFVGGVMNLWVIAAISLFILSERLVPRSSAGIGRISGLLLILAGLWAFLGPIISQR